MKKKANRPQVYLAHPISAKTLGSAHWKDEFMETYSYMDFGFKIHDPAKYGLVDGKDDLKIVQKNKLAISQSIAVIAFVEVPSAGTSMEMMFARMLHIPVFAYSRCKVSAWVSMHSTVYSTNSEIIKEVQKLAVQSVRKV